MPFERHSKYFHDILCKSLTAVRKLMHVCILYVEICTHTSAREHPHSQMAVYVFYSLVLAMVLMVHKREYLSGQTGFDSCIQSLF